MRAKPSFSDPANYHLSSGASRGAPHVVATLKARKGAFDTLNIIKGLEHLESEVKIVAPSGAPPEELFDFSDPANYHTNYYGINSFSISEM